MAMKPFNVVLQVKISWGLYSCVGRCELEEALGSVLHN